MIQRSSAALEEVRGHWVSELAAIDRTGWLATVRRRHRAKLAVSTPPPSLVGARFTNPTVATGPVVSHKGPSETRSGTVSSHSRLFISVCRWRGYPGYGRADGPRLVAGYESAVAVVGELCSASTVTSTSATHSTRLVSPSLAQLPTTETAYTSVVRSTAIWRGPFAGDG